MDASNIMRPLEEDIIEAIDGINNKGWGIESGIWIDEKKKCMCPLSAFILRNYAKELNNLRRDYEMLYGGKQPLWESIESFAEENFGKDFVEGFVRAYDTLSDKRFLELKKIRINLSNLVNAVNNHLNIISSTEEDRDEYYVVYSDVKELMHAVEEMQLELDYDVDTGRYS